MWIILGFGGEKWDINDSNTPPTSREVSSALINPSQHTNSHPTPVPTINQSHSRLASETRNFLIHADISTLLQGHENPYIHMYIPGNCLTMQGAGCMGWLINPYLPRLVYKPPQPPPPHLTSQPESTHGQERCFADCVGDRAGFCTGGWMGWGFEYIDLI